MFPKDIEEKIINLFVNACILGYRASFGALVYHTSIWFFSSISKLHFFVKMKLAQSFRNENMISKNAFEVFKNNVMEEEFLQECEINSRLQTKYNQNLESIIILL
jgi:hypothetical protein